MKLTELQERMLKVCCNINRVTDHLITMFYRKFHYQPQTIRNNLSFLYRYGYLKRDKKGKYFYYTTSVKGMNYVLDNPEIVDEVESRSSKDSGQVMLKVFTK